MTISLMSTICFAWNPFAGLVKAEVSAVKNQFDGEVTGLKGDVSLVKGKIDKLIEANIRLSTKIDSQVNANAAAVAALKSDIQTMSAGRDNINNDTGLMWKIIYGLLGIIGTLIANQFWVVKRLFKEMSNARFYQLQYAAKTSAEELDAMMQRKKVIEEERKQKSMMRKIASGLNKEVKFKKERVQE
jgi:hypothetical protein